MNLRLTDLKNFIEIAAGRTMSEGAEKLGITQPALSESIKRLEQDLQEILFYRSRSGITLTPGGHRCLIKAKEALSALGKLQGNLASGSRNVTIGCHATIASYFLPKALRLIQAENADCQISLRHDLSRTIQLEVQQGKIDIGIVVNAISSPDLIVRKLAQDEVCVWQNGKANNPRTERLFCDLSLFQTQSVLRKWKDKPKDIVNTTSLELIARFVNEGLGYGILPTRMISLLNLNECEHVKNTPTFQDSISVVYRPEFGKHPSEKMIIQNLKNSVQ